jgi:hypothetical protein
MLTKSIEQTLSSALRQPQLDHLSIHNNGRPARYKGLMLAGQGSKIFGVREALSRLLPQVKIIDKFQETAVIRGLALYGGVLKHVSRVGTNQSLVKDLLLLDALYSGVYVSCVSLADVPMQGRWRAVDQQDRDLLTMTVSSNLTENSRYEAILEAFTLCPTLNLVGIKFVGNLEHANLSVFERVDARPAVDHDKDRPEYVLLGRIPIDEASARNGICVTAEADSNRTLVISITSYQSRKFVGAYQLNNPWARIFINDFYGLPITPTKIPAGH